MKMAIMTIGACMVLLSSMVIAEEAKEVDSDGDGLSNRAEMDIHKTDPQLADTDTDGLSDGDEVLIYFTHPRLADTDGDGFLDGVEVRNDSDPLDPLNTPVSDDQDGDGLSNALEARLGTDPQRIDTDFDGLTDHAEYHVYFTDPLLVDSDGDGFWDGEEVKAGADPGDAKSFPAAH